MVKKNEEVFDVSVVKESDLPKIIGEQYTKLTKLEDSVEKAVKMAQRAEDKASVAEEASTGWFQKKEAIELLQRATKGLAEAQLSAVEAQKISFEYHTKLTEITKFLFALGVSNIAMNRSVVRELELKLKGASDADISDLAKQELKNVVMQLKAQEDLMMKQEAVAGKVNQHDSQLKDVDKQIDTLEEQDEEQDEKIAENAEEITKHAKELSSQAEKDKEHDKKIDDLEEQDEAQDKKIEELEEQDEAQDKILTEHEIELKKQQEIDTRLEMLTMENAQKIESLRQELADQISKNGKNNDIMWKIGITAVSVLALVLSIINFII